MRIISFAVILMVGFTLPPFSAAQDITYTPKLGLTGEYNDNILYSRTDKEDDFIFNVSPAIEATYVSQMLNLYSYAAMRFRRYSSEDQLDREDYFVNIQGRYRMTERLQFRGRLNYLQDYSLESRVVDLIKTDTDETPIDDPEVVERGIESFLSERKQYNAFASLGYQLTELYNLNMGYRYLKNDYDLAGNTDYEVNSINMTLMRNLKGQRDQIGTRVSYSESTTDSNDTESYGAGLIWNHFFTETMRLYTDIGVRYTEQNFNNTGQKTDDWNATANIRLRRTGETNVIDIGFRQNVQTSSSGRSVNVSRLFWDARQVLSERFIFELDGDFYITREDSDSISDTGTVFFDIIPSVRYMLTENHSVRLSYNYTIEHDRSLDKNRDTERNRLWIMFEFGFPRQL